MKVFSAIPGLLFGLLFAGIGAMILNETSIPTFESWHSMKSWQPATAILVDVGGSETSTEATYRYSVNGIQYVNNRVSVSEFKDNIGSYQRELRARLSDLKNRGQPLQIWYNPENARESVIDRDMRWGLFVLMTGFCSFFILIGLVVCYASINTSSKKGKFIKPSINEIRKEWQQKKAKQETREGFFDYYRYRLHELKQQAERQDGGLKYRPDPWLDRKQWQTERIRSDARTGVIGIWFFTIVWNAISSPILFAFMDEWRKGNHAIVVGLLFTAVGIVLLYKAIQVTREWRRFGIVELEMDPFPGSIGGHVGGTIDVRNLQDYEAEYKVELECVYSYMSGSGDNRSRSENIRWAESGTAGVELSGSGIRLSFRFDIPEDLPESDPRQSGDYYFWRLKLKGEIPGVDLDRSYNIPVFRTGVKSRHIKHDISAQAAEVRKLKSAETEAALASGDLYATDLAHSLRFSETANETRFYFPMFRNRILTIFCVVFGGGFSFATYMMTDGFNILAFDDFFNILTLIFAIPFALIGLLASMAAVYLLLNNLLITISSGRMTILRRLFVIPVVYKKLNASDINNMHVKNTGSTGQGIKKIEHFKVIVKTYDGKKFTIAEDIDGKDLADQFKDFISNRLGIS